MLSSCNIKQRQHPTALYLYYACALLVCSSTHCYTYNKGPTPLQNTRLSTSSPDFCSSHFPFQVLSDRIIMDSPRSEPQSAPSYNLMNAGPGSYSSNTGDSLTPPTSIPWSSFTSPTLIKGSSNIDFVMETIAIRRDLLECLIKGGMAARQPPPNTESSSHGTYGISEPAHYPLHGEKTFI